MKIGVRSLEILVVTIVMAGVQGSALAGRAEANPQQRLSGASDSAVSLPAPLLRRSIREANDADVPSTGGPDRALAEYLELHGRVVDGSMRSPMMPWSVLQPSAN